MKEHLRRYGSKAEQRMTKETPAEGNIQITKQSSSFDTNAEDYRFKPTVTKEEAREALEDFEERLRKPCHYDKTGLEYELEEQTINTIRKLLEGVVEND